MVCDVCGQEMVLKTIDFDYTRRAGLDPEFHQIWLRDVEALCCDCGEAPRIPNIEGLHYTIGLSLVRSEAPLDGSAVRFLRRTLGLTQRDFAAEFEMTPEYYSDWERGKHLPAKARRIFAGLAFLNHLLHREDTRRCLDLELLADTIELMTRHTYDQDLYPRREAVLEVDESASPPAWLIAEIEKGKQDGDGGSTYC